MFAPKDIGWVGGGLGTVCLTSKEVNEKFTFYVAFYFQMSRGMTKILNMDVCCQGTVEYY